MSVANRCHRVCCAGSPYTDRCRYTTTGAKGGDRCKPLLFQVGTTGPVPSGSDGCPVLIDPSTCRNASRSQHRTDGPNRGGISRLIGGTPTSRLEAAGSHKWLETGGTPLFCPRSGVPGEKREYNKTVDSTNTIVRDEAVRCPRLAQWHTRD